jgi:hypothetical protein
MDKITKSLLLGLVIWIIPFITSFFVWDTKANGPSIDVAWFYALMSLTGAIALAIAVYGRFMGVKKDAIKDGWITGIIWYVECILLDFVFLVVLLGMSMNSFAHLLLTYLTPFIVSVTVGYLKK